jgi:hypothetical protein
MQKENDELKSRLNTIEKEKDIDFLRSFNIKKDLLNEFYENFKNDFKKCTSRQELDLLMHRISTEKPSYFESTKNKQSNKQDFDEYVNYDAKTKSFIF